MEGSCKKKGCSKNHSKSRPRLLFKESKRNDSHSRCGRKQQKNQPTERNVG